MMNAEYSNYGVTQDSFEDIEEFQMVTLTS